MNPFRRRTEPNPYDRTVLLMGRLTEAHKAARACPELVCPDCDHAVLMSSLRGQACPRCGSDLTHVPVRRVA